MPNGSAPLDRSAFDVVETIEELGMAEYEPYWPWAQGTFMWATTNAWAL